MSRFLFLVVALVAVAIAFSKKPTWRELEKYSFDDYVSDFGIKLENGSSEWQMRKAIFIQEVARVKAHNAKKLSWKEGVNKFSALTAAEKKAYFGRSKGAKKNHVPKTRQESPKFNRRLSDLPTDVDWRNAGIVSPVKDQGYCGSCWAFASTAVIESAVAKSTGLLYDLSVQQMTVCAPNPDSCGGTGGCQGSTAELAFDYVATAGGLVEEYQYGYANYYGGAGNTCTVPSSSPFGLISGYVQLPTNNYTALINAVATVGPIAISVDASSWGAYESGIFDGCNQKNPDIDHAVVLVGYGTDAGQSYYLVRNSWSPSWGEKGYIRVARKESEDEVCGIDTTPQDGVACAGDNTPEKVCGTCGIIFDTAYPVGAK